MRCNIDYKSFLTAFWIVLLASLLSFSPASVYAATGTALTDTGNAAIFTPSSGDQSIIYLGELFGNMPPVLAGTGSSIMGDIFKVFNTAILTLAIILVGYTTFVSILNTAGEGEMLGKAWNSIWVPIRTVAGIGLLIPTSSGYCVCQTFMMWLLIQGIGAADTLTGTVINYMESGKQVFVAGDTSDTNGTSSSYSQYDSTVTTLFQGLSCMQSYQKDFPLVNTNIELPTGTLNTTTNTIDYKFQTFYASNATSTVPLSISCGTVSIDNSNSVLASYIQKGVDTILPSLNSAAYFMVNDSSTVENTVMQDTFNFVGSDFLNEVEKAYQSYIIEGSSANTAADADATPDSGNSYYEDIRAYGWVSLGNLYWNVAKSYSTNNSQKPEAAKLKWNTSTSYIAETAGATDDFSTNAIKYGGVDGWGSQFIADLIASRDKPTSDGSSFEDAGNLEYRTTTGVVAAIAQATLYGMIDQLSKDGNPLILAQELGHEITYDIEAAFAVLQTIFPITAAMAGFGSGPLFIASPATTVAIITTFIVVLPGIFSFCAAMLVLGGTLAVAIPFMPALAYFLAVIAWLIAALETIVAAPIVAIGVLHPDGQHQVWGKAEPAVMLIINMFLRPSLIVIGMIAGILLSSISMQFVNFGFQQALENVMGNSGSTSGIECMMFIATYVALVAACVNKSFSVIDALPDTVMRWIQGGEGTKFGGGQEAMQKIQGQQEGAGQKAGEASAHGAQAATDSVASKGGAKLDAQKADAQEAKDAERHEKTMDALVGPRNGPEPP